MRRSRLWIRSISLDARPPDSSTLSWMDWSSIRPYAATKPGAPTDTSSPPRTPSSTASSRAARHMRLAMMMVWCWYTWACIRYLASLYSSAAPHPFTSMQTLLSPDPPVAVIVWMSWFMSNLP